MTPACCGRASGCRRSRRPAAPFDVRVARARRPGRDARRAARAVGDRCRRRALPRRAASRRAAIRSTLAPAARTTVGSATWAPPHATTDAPPGGYDLYVHPTCDAATRAPSAVWLRADDPAKLGEVHVVHSVGHPRRQARRRRRGAPQAGDRGDQRARARPRRHHRRHRQPGDRRVAASAGARAADHDPRAGGHRARQSRHRLSLVRGRHTMAGLGELRSHLPLVPRVRDRPRRLSLRRLRLGAVDAVAAHPDARARRRRRCRTYASCSTSAASDGSRGVVLFSHAPSRAVLSGQTPATGGTFGHMREGRAEFERMLLDAAARGQRVLHLAGHTHWNDVFEAEPASGSARVRALGRRHRRRQADADSQQGGDGDDAGGDARRAVAEGERARLRLYVPRARRRRCARSRSTGTPATAEAPRRPSRNAIADAERAAVEVGQPGADERRPRVADGERKEAGPDADERAAGGRERRAAVVARDGPAAPPVCGGRA